MLLQKEHIFTMDLQFEIVVHESGCGVEIRPRFHPLNYRDVGDIVAIGFLSNGIRY